MRSKATIAILGLAAATFALPAAAQNWMSSVYIGGGLGQSKAKKVCDDLLPGESCDDKDTTFKIFAGYQFNRNFAAEVGYTDLGKAKISAGGLSDEFKATAWELSAIGAFPVWQQLSLFGRLGGYYGEGKISGVDSGNKKTTNLTYGLGAQYDFTRNLGVRAEWQRYAKIKFRDDATGTEDDADVDVLGVSVLWRFQ